jgi:hypothetical protein
MEREGMQEPSTGACRGIMDGAYVERTNNDDDDDNDDGNNNDGNNNDGNNNKDIIY